ncbi:hypothetical protein [Priestia aryabhattai]
MSNDTQQKHKSWTDDEDTLLKDEVLEYVKSGKTQLLAFQEVANQTGRTTGSVAFRWNNTLRQLYSNELKEAKQEAKKNRTASSVSGKASTVASPAKARKTGSKQVNSTNEPTSSNSIDAPIKSVEKISFDDVISFLEDKKKIEDRYNKLNADYLALQEEHNNLTENFEQVCTLVSKFNKS